MRSLVQRFAAITPRACLMSRLGAVMRLLRIENVLCVIPAVLLGSSLAGGPSTSRAVGGHALAAAVVAAFICAAGNALNDYCDIEIDRVNAPRRPLPAGDLAPSVAQMLAVVLLAVALSLAAVLGLTALLVAAGLGAASCLYAARLKRTLAGHAVVGAITAMTPVYGGLVSGAVLPALWPALLIFLGITSRELLKATQDVAGDAAHGARTVATVCGRQSALHGFAAGSAALLVVALTPFISGRFGPLYLIALLAGFYPVTLLAIREAYRASETQHFRRALLLTKAGFMLGLAVMYLGAIR